MRIIFNTLLFSFLTIASFSQSVTIEPGKSLFDHSLEGSELKGTGQTPIKIKSADDTLNVDFFSQNILRSRIQVTPFSTAIRSNNSISLLTGGIPRLWIDNQGKVGISDFAASGTYRLTVRSNDEFVASFFNNTPFGKATINFNNDMYLETSTADGAKFYGANGYSFVTFNDGDFNFSSNNFEKFRILGGNGNVGIGTVSPQTKLEVNGFTKLGSDAPAIKVKKLTGTTSSTQGGQETILHGLTESKILSISVMVEYGSGKYVHPAYLGAGGYQFEWYSSLGGITIWNRNSNSSFILSKPVKILITYEE